MAKYEVLLSMGESVDLFRGLGFGASPIRYAAIVEADSPDEAKAAARKQVATRNGFEDYAKGRVVEIHRWVTVAITLRGKRDARRRETFFVSAPDVKTAFRRLPDAAYRFAGVVLKESSPAVVRWKVVE